jgi:phthiocerol/phenolphthiocerol synthesis type-I polyketide synthase C
MPAPATPDCKEPIAIVGMAGRFPGAASVAALWEMLVERGNGIRAVPAERWDRAALLDPERTVQSVGGFVDGVEQFDPTFFGISPREAVDMDPQQRLMLEATWQALEDAGRPAAGLRGSRTGVYVGASWHDYELVRSQRGALATQHSGPGSALDVIAARVSYFLGLRGPSLVVETGCSSSLVALHMACQGLRSGELDGALVGGVNLILAPDVSVALTRFGALSPEGRCKTFAAAADGFVRGEGAIAVYVKRLSRAIADGDRIHAVIAGSAVNNDGGGDSLVTPSPAGQDDLLARAYADAGVAADDVVYVEAHGTGTPVGDPIEARALGRALGQRRSAARGPLAIGSIKTNIGHLEAAAGLAGLVKAVLALEHRLVPPNLHGDALNPAIDFEALQLCVVREALALPADGTIYAGVNSFGWGGTNAHVVLGSAPAVAAAAAVAAAPVGPVVVPVSAHSEAALRQRARDIADLASAGASLEAIAGTLGWQRDQFRCRAAVVAGDAGELAAKLAAFAASAFGTEGAGSISGTARPHQRTAFVFPGQGAQWIGMGRALLATSPRFAAVIGRCAAALAPHVAWDLVACLAGDAGEWASRVDVVQPVLWAMSVALAELWREAGIEPDVVIGHSQGEIAAATVAGALSYEDAARIVAVRSQIARRVSGRGAMLAVELDAEAAAAALAGFEGQVGLAAHNGPRSCVLSGDAEAVALLHELLEAEGTFSRLVKVDYASHSHHMDELRGDLVAALAGIAPVPARTQMISSVDAAAVAGGELDAAYWARNLRQPVRFAEAMARAFDAGVTHAIEISPHPVLAPAIEQLAAQRAEPPTALSTLRRDAGTAGDFAMALARAFAAGLAPFGGLPRRASLALPAYPWQREAYWIAPSKRRPAAGAQRAALALVPTPGEVDAWHGTIELGLDDQPWLRDHKVHEAIVLPGAAMLALALDAARARDGGQPTPSAGLPERLEGAVPEHRGGPLSTTAVVTLVDVRFHRTVTLGEDPVRMCAAWRDEAAGGGSLALLSMAAGAPAWTEHATARVQRGAPAVTAAFPAELRAQAAIDADRFYRSCAARGLHYGPAFQGVARVFVEGDAALGEVRLPDACRGGAQSAGLHAALWDAALQVCLALCADGTTVVPSAVARVSVLRDLAAAPAALWSHAVRRGADRFDVAVFDAAEQPVMKMEGLTLTALPVAIATPDADRLHRLQFHEQACTTAETTPATWAWVVYGDGRTVLDTAAATRARIAWPADAEDAAAWREALAMGEAPSGVVFVAPPASAGLDAQRRGLIALAALGKACTQLGSAPRLVVVTANGQTATDEDRPDPGAAMYVAMARVAGREHPELQVRSVDVDAADAAWVPACAAELAAGDGEDQVALRGGRRLVGRLVRGSLEPEGAGHGERGGVAQRWTTPRQAFRLHAARPGLLDALEFRPLARRAPAAGEIEVEVAAAALNFIDAMTAMGTYPGHDDRAARLGGECAGRVVAVGAGVTGMQVGDRVVACGFGSFASHATVRADHAQHIPSDLDDEAAAGLPLVLTTAWYGLHDLARLAPGETVLIHSAAGGLGLAAIQVARRLGARVIATAGSEAKRCYLRGRGIAHVFDSRDGSWVEGVRAATGGAGVDVVLNSLTGAAIGLGLDALAEDGRFIEVGKQDIHGGRSLRLAAFKKGISFAAVDLAGLMERRPERFARALAAAWAHVSSAAILPLPTTAHRFADAADALRTLARGAHIGKLVLTAPESVTCVAPEAMPEGRFRGDATYLITGGLGALGLSLAEFMAERGAAALALAGRSAPSAAAEQRIAALRARGVRVETLALDVADAAAVDRALAEVRCTMPALRGVIHAAGVLDDATLANLAPAQLARVLAPKIDGARHLDAATAGDALDVFAMFSSAAALVGNAGQAAYAAANAYLDALAIARRRRGRPALSVQWGPFAEIGLAAADHARGARLAERGMGGFTAPEAWRALAGMLADAACAPVVGYVPLDLRRWFDAYPATAALPSWQALRAASRQADGSTGAAVSGAFRSQLEASSETARRPLAEAKVRELAGRVLRLAPGGIDSETPFKALGLDSLMGLELRNRLESAFGLTLSPTLLWTYGSPRALAGALCERVFRAAA